MPAPAPDPFVTSTRRLAARSRWALPGNAGEFGAAPLGIEGGER